MPMLTEKDLEIYQNGQLQLEWPSRRLVIRAGISKIILQSNEIIINADNAIQKNGNKIFEKIDLSQFTVDLRKLTHKIENQNQFISIQSSKSEEVAIFIAPQIAKGIHEYL